jgi:hypothetical protein
MPTKMRLKSLAVSTHGDKSEALTAATFPSP